MIGIRDAAYFLPGPPVDVVKWGPEQGVSEELICRLIANRCRYFYMSNDFSDADLACLAIDQLFISSQIKPKEVDFLIYAHTQPFSGPAAPHSIVSEICVRSAIQPLNAFAFEHLGCATVVHAVSWGHRLLRQYPYARNVVVVTSDRVFGDVPWRIRQDACIQSDGGSAILLSREKVKGVMQNFVFDNLVQLHQGPFHGENEKLVKRTCWPQTRKLLTKCAKVAGMPIQNIGKILPINADWPIWRIVSRGLQISEDLFFTDNFTLKGHACSNDLAINLCDIGFKILADKKTILSFGQSNIGAQAALLIIPPEVKHEEPL